MSNNSSIADGCYMTWPFNIVYMCLNITSILTFPFFIIVLYLAYSHTVRRRSSQPSSSSSGAVAVSHSDVFTLHMAVVELIGILGSVVRLYGHLANKSRVIHQGYLVFFFMWYGEALFHTLTCIDRYLAVVHPVTYTGLRQGRGAQLRNVVIAGVWLICIIKTWVAIIGYDRFVEIAFLSIVIFIIVFCSLSVLRALIRPGPGSRSVNRIDQNKRRAFKTILNIMIVLLWRYMWSLLTMLFVFSANTHFIFCVFLALECIVWIPSSFVLPVLYLHKIRATVCCNHCSR